MILVSGVVKCDGCCMKSHPIKGSPASIRRKLSAGGWRAVGKKQFCWICLYYGKHLTGRARAKFVAKYLNERVLA